MKVTSGLLDFLAGNIINHVVRQACWYNPAQNRDLKTLLENNSAPLKEALGIYMQDVSLVFYWIAPSYKQRVQEAVGSIGMSWAFPLVTQFRSQSSEFRSAIDKAYENYSQENVN